MKTNLEKAIEGLKWVRLELFRSAANLDALIVDLETLMNHHLECLEDKGAVYIALRELIELRQERRNTEDWNTFVETENAIYENLLRGL